MRKRLPGRDYILLPLISLLTVAVMLVFAEVAAYHFFPDAVPDSCFYGSPTGPRDRANCISYERVPESPLIKNTFDACGYRSLHGCGPKRPGTFRIAVLGSSIAEAHLVPQEESYMALAGSRFDIIPVAAPLASPVHSLMQINDVLALHPDAVIQVLSPIDIEALWVFLNEPSPDPNVSRPSAAQTTAQPQQPTHQWNEKLRQIQDELKERRAVFAAEHFLFADDDTFLRLYMLYGYKADFLRPPFSPAWQKRFSELDSIDAKIAARLHAAGIPFYLTAVPSRADAVLMHRSPNAFAWGDQIAEIARHNGAHYIDALHAFAKTPHPGELFYTVDGHMNAAAQPVLKDALLTGLACPQNRAR